MSYEVTVILPVQSYLKKMIAKTNKTEPFRIKRGMCIYSHIFYHSLGKQNLPVPPFSNPTFNEKISILLPYEIVKESRFTFTPSTISYVDKTLRAVFNDKFETYMNDNCFEFGDISKYVGVFMGNYNLDEEDLQFDSLKKRYYRIRAKNPIKDNINFRKKRHNQQTPEDSQIKMNLQQQQRPN